jgi:hypothetical protein
MLAIFIVCLSLALVAAFSATRQLFASNHWLLGVMLKEMPDEAGRRLGAVRAR